MHLGHRYHLPGSPRPSDTIAMLELLQLGRAALLRHALPRDLAEAVVAVRGEGYVHQGSFWPLLVAAIDEPSMALLSLQRAHGPYLQARTLGRREDGEALVLLNGEVETLHPGLAQAREVVIRSIGRLLNELLRGPTIPSARDVDLAVGHWRLRGRRAEGVAACVALAADVVVRTLLADAAGLEAAALRLWRRGLDCERSDMIHPTHALGATHGDVVQLVVIQLPSLAWTLRCLRPQVCAGVGATEPERRHTGVAAAGAEVRAVVGKEDRIGVDVAMGVEVFQVDVAWAGAVLQDGEALDQACHASIRLTVLQVRLRAGLANRQRPDLHDAAQSAHLDGISQGGACAVQLRHAHIAGHNIGLSHGGAQALLL
mmetsp:Transcript_17794/g.49331  ORF Transcript_17794/g.49331 Transcript_17794/m.49331 type:complete len:372 (+) Transcript_17794:781-1896(+)